MLAFGILDKTFTTLLIYSSNSYIEPSFQFTSMTYYYGSSSWCLPELLVARIRKL